MFKVGFCHVLMIAMCVNGLVLTVQEQPSATPEVFKKPDTMMMDLYRAISSEIGSQPDWNYVKSFFHPDAVIVFRASRTEMKMFDVDGFIQDFIDMYKRIDFSKNSFKEKVVSIKTMTFGNIAHCYVVYEASVPTSKRPPVRGLDSWHLVKKGDSWHVISVVNDVELAAGPIPKEVFKR